MEKTKIKQEFTPWAASIHAGEDFLFRSSEIKRISVGLTTFNVLLGPYCLHDIGTSLSDALAKADNYIAENFEVEKPVEQRLKEAEAEIVTLKEKVTKLEAPATQPKFKVGDLLTQFAWDAGKYYEVAKVTYQDGKYMYEFKGYVNIPYPEDALILVEDDGYKFKIGQKVRIRNDRSMEVLTISSRENQDGLSSYKLTYQSGTRGSLSWCDNELIAV